MKNDLVSIALTTYNSERFLRKQLDSIYNQSYKNIEIIACDDQSTDSTVEILEEYKNKHGLQYHVNKVNLGYLKNFEKVLGLCNGIYIALSDHDDIWLPNKIERLVDNIGDYSLIFSDAFYIDNNDNIFSSSIKVYSGFEVFSGKPIKYLAFNNFITGCTALFKRELLLIALPIPTAEQFHDWWIGLVACTMNGLIYLPEPLIFYRRHAGNTIGLRKKGSPLYRFFGFLKKAIDKRALEIQVNRMEMLRQNRIFSDDERKCFQMAFEYFYDRLQSKIHKKAFLIALSNFRYIFPNVFGIYRIKAIIGTLLG